MKSTYVHVKRSETTRQPGRPILDLDPVQYSLTEGTDIPAPPQEVDNKPKPPVLPVLRVPSQQELRPASRHSGPLSSHPVTPIDGNHADGAYEAFPFDPEQSIYSNSNRHYRTDTASSAPLPKVLRSKASAGGDSLLSEHQHNGVRLSPINSMNPPPPPPYRKEAPDQESNSRRPSFASRFLKFRTFSSLRSRNSSSTTLNMYDQHGSAADSTRQSTDALNDTGPRGRKRPGSPGLFSNGLYDQNGPANGNAQGSQSFPRMVRKKSMELFGTARRRSGMFGGRNDMENSAMEEEAHREHEREADEEMEDQRISKMDTSTTGRSSRLDMDGADDIERTMSARSESMHEPPPVLPELDEIGKSMEGEDMFRNIGRD